MGAIKVFSILTLILSSAFFFILASSSTADNSNSNVIEVQSVQDWNRRLMTAANSTLVLAQFYLSWCPYCQVMKPEFERLSVQNPDVLFLNVDAGARRTIADAFGLTSVPTYKIFKATRNLDTLTTWRASVLQDLINRLK